MSKTPRLTTIKPRIQSADMRLVQPQRTAEKRLGGRARQNQRLRIWTANPRCVDCGRLTGYPQGFELDHDTPIEQGGSNDDSNMKIRCVWYGVDGTKQGCHEAKTKMEAKSRSGFA